MTKEFDNSDKIDDLERRLYSPRQDIEIRERKKLREKEYVVANSWEQENPPQEVSPLSATPRKKNWFIAFFLVAFLFFLGTAGFVGYKFIFQEGIQAKNVDILINAPLTIGAGEVFTFDVLLQNKNAVDMNTVDMTIEFPEGTRSTEDISQNYSITRNELGSIAVGSVLKSTQSALLFGEEGDEKEIVISLSYRVEGSNLLIEKEKKFTVVLKSTPIRMTITNVKEITSGQNLVFNVELTSNSSQTLKDVIVQATYPFGFSYQRSSREPESDKKTWIIPSLDPKETVNFTFEGSLEGQNNEERYFSFLTGLENPDTGTAQVVFTTSGTTVTLARPFLELGLAINSSSGDVIILDPDVTYGSVISYKNNTDSQLRRAMVTLTLAGEAINKSSIQSTEGFYQSTNNTIQFDESTNPKLQAIPVGSSGESNFSFRGTTNRNGEILINPEVTVETKVEANRKPENEVPEMIESIITKKIRFNTQSKIEGKSEYFDSIFSNSGPIPPKAESKTTYTVILEISNTSNKIADGIVTAKLPNYVTYEGVYSPTNADFSYDPKTRIIQWKVGTVNEKTGYLGNLKKSLAIQISFLPSVSQIGTSPNLVTDIKFEGTDVYTKKFISNTTQNITTSIAKSQTYYDSQVSR